VSFPTRLFLDEDRDSIDSMAVGLREILLQENIEENGMGFMVSELVVYACTEAANGISTKSRRNAYELLHQLFFVPAGSRELERLGRPGGLLEKLANKVFDK
jgi:hypothetical protein